MRLLATRSGIWRKCSPEVIDRNSHPMDKDEQPVIKWRFALVIFPIAQDVPIVTNIPLLI